MGLLCAFVLPLCLISIPAAYAEQNVNNHLPNGLQSMSENYQDWRLICREVHDKSRCEIVQEEFDDKNQMKVLTFEMTPGNFSSLKGVIVVPLGVDVSRHISVMADGENVTPPLPFSTCVITGCLIPLKLDAKEVERLQRAHNIVIRFVTMSGRTIYVALSEKGLDKAITRMRNLSA